MTFKPAKCPNCAGDLQVPDDRDSVKCMYCGSDIIVREDIKIAGGVNVESLTELLKFQKDSGNWNEVYLYSTKVLEVDHKNYEAWLWKGLSAVELSTFMDIKYDEALRHVKKAIEYAPQPKKDELINLAIFAINRKSNELLNIIRRTKLQSDDLIGICDNLFKVLQGVNNLYPNLDTMKIIVDVLSNKPQTMEWPNKFSLKRIEYVNEI